MFYGDRKLNLRSLKSVSWTEYVTCLWMCIRNFIPKSVKSTSQILGSTPWTSWLRYYQKSKEKDWSDLGITWVSCSGIHPEAITHFIPKSDKSKSQHSGSTPWTPWLRHHQQSKEKDWSDLGATRVKCSGIHPEPWTQCTPKTDKLTLRVNTTNAMP